VVIVILGAVTVVIEDMEVDTEEEAGVAALEHQDHSGQHLSK
jgi:hypothetical protein